MILPTQTIWRFYDSVHALEVFLDYLSEQVVHAQDCSIIILQLCSALCTR